MRLGLLPHGSSCPRDEERLISVNLAIITGRRGLGVCADIMALMRADPCGEEWHGDLGLRYADCVPLLLTCMCDSWRRLSLMYAGLPWQLFRMVEMSTAQSVDFLQELRRGAGECPSCQDRLFFMVTWRGNGL